MKHKILLIGAGGHCKVVLDLLMHLKNYEIAGIIGLKQNLKDKVLDIPVIGIDADLPGLFEKGIKHCFISIGSVGNSNLRCTLYNTAKKLGFVFPNLISPDAEISSHIFLGEGNYVAPGVIINAGTRIGNNCIINTGVLVEHDCKIGDFVHLSPGSILNGGVSIGNRSHIGAGSVIIQNLKIGQGTIVGAGSVVTKNMSEFAIAYGNPCKERRENA